MDSYYGIGSCERRTPMAQKTLLAGQIDLADKKARLNNACKKLLANRMILAWIMKHTMEEFQEYDVREIAEHCIEGEPIIAGIAVHRDTKPTEADRYQGEESIKGENVEDASITEGTVTFDIRFRAIVPKSGETITLILNIEAQNDFFPGYPLVKRGVYYCCRMISGQYGVEFVASHYEKIKKVYSVWICMNPPKYRQHTITKYHMAEDIVLGESREEKVNYDLLTAVLICLGDPKRTEEYSVVHLLSVIFSDELEAEEKKAILAKMYGIAMTRELEQEVTDMCDYGDAIEAKGIAKGKAAGIQQGIQVLLETLREMNLNYEDTLQKLEEKFHLSREEAEDYMKRYWR